MTYIAISLIAYEPIINPAVSIAGRESTRGLHVHYCYSTALQSGGEYAENHTLSSMIYGPRLCRRINVMYVIRLIEMYGL